MAARSVRFSRDSTDRRRKRARRKRARRLAEQFSAGGCIGQEVEESRLLVQRLPRRRIACPFPFSHRKVTDARATRQSFFWLCVNFCCDGQLSNDTRVGTIPAIGWFEGHFYRH